MPSFVVVGIIMEYIIIIFRLTITCDNSRYGCTVEVKLEGLSYHLAECEHNPTRPVPCKQGCGLVIPKDELKVLIFLFI